MKYNAEIGAVIKRDPATGAVYLSAPVTSYHSHKIDAELMLSVKVLGTADRKLNRTAFVHTHSRGGTYSEQFSGGQSTRAGAGSSDLPFAVYWDANAYVATPQGNLKKFTLNRWTQGMPMRKAVTTIRKDIRTYKHD